MGQNSLKNCIAPYCESFGSPKHKNMWVSMFYIEIISFSGALFSWLVISRILCLSAHMNWRKLHDFSLKNGGSLQAVRLFRNFNFIFVISVQPIKCPIEIESNSDDRVQTKYLIEIEKLFNFVTLASLGFLKARQGGWST